MASLFDGPTLGGLFGDIQAGPERQALNMGLLGFGLGLLETGQFGQGIRNFLPLYQSGLQSGQAAEDWQRKKEEAEREKAAEERRQAAADKLRGVALGGYMGGEGPSPGSIRAGQETGLVPQGLFDTGDPRRRVVSSLFDYDPNQAVELVTSAAFPDPASPQTALAKAGRDLEAGFITQDQYDALAANATRAPAGATNENDRQIQALMNRGFSQADAEDIAYGFVTVSPPDQFGNVYLVNKADGTSRIATGNRRGMPPDSAGLAATPEAPAPETGAPAVASAEPRPSIEQAARGGTGPYASIFAAYDAIAGGLLPDAITGSGSLAPETQQYRQQLRVFNQMAKTALVNNPRFPVAEQEIVARLLPNPDAVFTNPDTEAQRAQQLRQTLQALKDQNQASINSGNITQEQMALLADKNAEIDRILGLMGTPAQQGAAPPAAPQSPQASQGGITATGPNGEKIRLNPQTNQWEPM